MTMNVIASPHTAFLFCFVYMCVLVMLMFTLSVYLTNKDEYNFMFLW